MPAGFNPEDSALLEEDRLLDALAVALEDPEISEGVKRSEASLGEFCMGVLYAQPEIARRLRRKIEGLELERRALMSARQEQNQAMPRLVGRPQAVLALLASEFAVLLTMTALALALYGRFSLGQWGAAFEVVQRIVPFNVVVWTMPAVFIAGSVWWTWWASKRKRYERERDAVLAEFHLEAEEAQLKALEQEFDRNLAGAVKNILRWLVEELAQPKVSRNLSLTGDGPIMWVHEYEHDKGMRTNHSKPPRLRWLSDLLDGTEAVIILAFLVVFRPLVALWQPIEGARKELRIQRRFRAVGLPCESHSEKPQRRVGSIKDWLVVERFTCDRLEEGDAAALVRGFIHGTVEAVRQLRDYVVFLSEILFALLLAPFWLPYAFYLEHRQP